MCVLRSVNRIYLSTRAACERMRFVGHAIYTILDKLQSITEGLYFIQTIIFLSQEHIKTLL